jgi:hypothetical protein
MTLTDNRNADNTARTNGVFDDIFGGAVKIGTTLLTSEAEEDAAKAKAKALTAQQRLESEKSGTLLKLGLIGGAVVLVIIVVMMFRK